MNESSPSRIGPYAALSPRSLSARVTLRDVIHASLKKPGRGFAGSIESASAVLVVTPDGASLRNILTGRRFTPSGFYESQKAGRAMPFESMNEAALLKYCEVDTRVVDYLSQPFRFEFVMCGKKRIYLADCARLLDDGTVEVVEAKGDRSSIGDLDYVQKLDCVRDLCLELGWRFKVITRKRLLEPAPVHANVEFIQSRRHVPVETLRGHRAIERILHDDGRSTLGRLAEIWTSWQSGLAAIQSMMVRRRLAIDVTRPISRDSYASLISQAPATLLGRAAR
jgi:hypothetical protein